MRGSKFSQGVRRGLGLDLDFIAKWVALHERVCECDQSKVGTYEWMGICDCCKCRLPDTPAFDVGQISWLMASGSESKVAVTMKYAVAEGYAQLMKGLPRGQAAWRPTDKALREFPLDQPHVMPEHEPVEGESGTFTPLSPQEVQRQTIEQLVDFSEQGFDAGIEVGGTTHKPSKELPSGEDD